MRNYSMWCIFMSFNIFLNFLILTRKLSHGILTEKTTETFFTFYLIVKKCIIFAMKKKLWIMGELILCGIAAIIITVIFIKENKSGAYDNSDFGPWNYNWFRNYIISRLISFYKQTPCPNQNKGFIYFCRNRNLLVSRRKWLLEVMRISRQQQK